MRPMLILFALLSFTFADSYLLNGGQQSTINYTMLQKVYPDPDTRTVTITIVEPRDFSSPTFNQEISDFRIETSVEPADIENLKDERGNPVMKYTWKPPFKPFDLQIFFTAQNHVVLKTLNTQAPFPLTELPAEARPYLQATEQVPSDEQTFRNKAAELTREAVTEFDAVQKILSWVIDHMSYVLVPDAHDAGYSMETGKGNCQNYSHLAAALMRAKDIPVRIINGVTLKQPYEIEVGSQKLRMNMAEGRHSWIEVWFPDLGWVPFDPQQTQLFVSNRFIRIEAGLDNNDTMDDGLIRWTRVKGSAARVSFEEIIEGEFITDDINVIGEIRNYGPRKILLTPQVEARFEPVAIEPAERPKPPGKTDQKPQGPFNKPFIMGNLEYPEDADFIFAREAHEAEGGSVELRKNFLVETAEYVTSKLHYAQTFILNKPLNLHSIGLVLHKFGGSGQLWLELREDINGAPSEEVAVRSEPVNLTQLSSKPGYEWIDFSFKDQKLILTPDRYWFSLAFSGSPIVNWFYSYGKPVGPVDGTRFKKLNEKSFSQIVGFEFNYRVEGLVQ